MTPLIRATRDDAPALAALFAPYTDELAIHGVIGDPARFIDRYWTEPDRHPYLIHHQGHAVGFAMVNRQSLSGDPIDAAMAEFYVIPAARRTGIGRAAALAAINAHPGQWELWVADSNTPALAFWAGVVTDAAIAQHSALPVDDGVIHRFVSDQP